MPVSTFFNNYKSFPEQGLLEDLVIESIKIYGMDIHYIPRVPLATDSMYNEDKIRKYVGNYPIEVYIKNVEGFGGDGDFLSKFNITISDQITLTIAVRQFMRYVATYQDISRPREGDLIYFPLNQKMFEIKFVEHEPVFYQLGALQMYDIKLELFEYNNDIFETGLDYVDNIYRNRTLDVNVPIEAGEQYVNEDYTEEEQYTEPDIAKADPAADNETMQNTANEIMVFDETDPFSEGKRY